jgi:SEFIR domain
LATAAYVFISYSRDSDLQVQRVVQLANTLRGEGVEAWIDEWEQSPPETWPLWCYKQVQRADFVLVICTETYARRVLREEEPGVGRGATWEGGIISNVIYENSAGQSKFIPAVFSAADTEHVPFFLAGYSVYNLSAPDSFTDLYRRLTGQHAHVPESIGPVIARPPEQIRTPPPVAEPPPGATLPPMPQWAPAVTLAAVIQGAWAVQIQHPTYGMLSLRIQLSGPGAWPNGGPSFAAQGVVGPPGWMAAGQWQILPGEQLQLVGNQQTGVPPYQQAGPYQEYVSFFSVTQNALTGVDSSGVTVNWRRE